MNATASDLTALSAEINACRRCSLWRAATQAVPGRGALRSAVLLVGEQPGDQEDLAGEPFVGPAGRVLDEALDRAGLMRSDLFVTNAVKHFKHETRGKRRLHKRPDASEVQACRFWLDREIALVAPRVIVAMGATAAIALVGHAVPVIAARHQLHARGEAKIAVTIHPSYVLRQRDNADRKAWARRLSDDLGRAARLATTLLE